MKFSPVQSLATLTLSFIPRCNFIFLLSCGVYIFQKLSNPSSDLPRFQNDKVKQAKCISKYKPLSDGANMLKPIENDLTSLSVILAMVSFRFFRFILSKSRIRPPGFNFHSPILSAFSPSDGHISQVVIAHESHCIGVFVATLGIIH